MKPFIKKTVTFLFLLVLIVLLVPITGLAGEDYQAPEVLWAGFADDQTKAGDTVQFQIKVKEEGTGVKEAFFCIQNKDQDGFDSGKIVFETPRYSTEEEPLLITIDLNTTEQTKNGEYYVQEFYVKDFKGNTVSFMGGPQGYFFIEETDTAPEIRLESDSTHMQIYGSLTPEKEDTTPPVLNWVKITTEEVEKPGEVEIALNITDDKSGLALVRIDLCHETDSYYAGKKLCRQ